MWYVKSGGGLVNRPQNYFKVPSLLQSSCFTPFGYFRITSHKHFADKVIRVVTFLNYLEIVEKKIIEIKYLQM